MPYYPPAPKRTDSKLSFGTYRDMYDQAKRFKNLKFDPNFFQVNQDGSGIYVSLNNKSVASGADEQEYHFQCVANNASNVACCIVHAGSWTRHILGDTVKIVNMEVDGGGSSEFYDDSYNLEFPGVGTYYVYVELDDPLSPGNLYVKWTNETALPTSDYENMAVVLARVNVASHVIDEQEIPYVADIEQYWTGGNINDENVVPDTKLHMDDPEQKSLDRHPQGNYMEIYNFHTPEGEFSASDKFLVRNSTEGVPKVNYLSPEQVTVLVGVRFSGGKFEYQTRDIWTFDPSDVSAWTEFADTQECDP